MGRTVTSMGLGPRRVARGLQKGLMTVWPGCGERCHVGRIWKDEWHSFQCIRGPGAVVLGRMNGMCKRVHVADAQ